MSHFYSRRNLDLKELCLQIKMEMARQDLTIQDLLRIAYKKDRKLCYQTVSNILDRQKGVKVNTLLLILSCLGMTVTFNMIESPERSG